MSTQQLLVEAMALPVSERAAIAQSLWESLDSGLRETDERTAMSDAVRRDAELSSGAIAGRTHDKVMQAARHAIRCG